MNIRLIMRLRPFPHSLLACGLANRDPAGLNFLSFNEHAIRNPCCIYIRTYAARARERASIDCVFGT